MSDIRIDKLGGKPILYDRSVPAHYGVTGVPMKPMINPVFAHQCDSCFSEIFQILGNGLNRQVKSILSGGVSRAGAGLSFHHKNRAFDLDGLMFTEAGTWVANTFPARPHLYLAIEAVLRKHFGTVLSYDYNKAHEDHFHFDNGTPVGFKKSAKSHVIFVQNAIFHVYHIKIGRDGVWGGETEKALAAVLAGLGIGPLASNGNWSLFLDAVAADSLALEAAL